MRRYLNAMVVAVLLAAIGGLVAGLIEETRQLRLITDMVARSNCAPLRSEFSHVAFAGYHLALSMVLAAGCVLLGALGLVAAYGWFARRLADRFF
jgi:hypothetical protein